jgi:DNA-binding NarL/FixJ family response regulator
MKILLVDDHKMFREGVSDFLMKESFCEAVIQASTVEEARHRVADGPPDVVVTDLSLPDEPGQNLLRWLAEEHPTVPSLCMTMHSEMSAMREVIAAGARGFVTKESGYKELVEAIRRVESGELYLDQVMLGRVLDYIERGGGSGPGADGAVGELSQREREVFFLLLEDKDAQQIGEALFISPKTVENHRTSIYRKLGVRDRLSLFQFARSNGLVE